MTLPLAKTTPTDAATKQNTIVGFDTNQGGKQVYVSSGYTPGISATPVKTPVTTNNAVDKAASDKVA